ncbi:MAG: Fic family protein [Candidatus Omnitrophota bacterium]|nr:Fic family protein [Candidatus Omnitrophota bacterium]MDZ4242438.1 Fic family protein [Candidatus Omnitrophota bacterium]
MKSFSEEYLNKIRITPQLLNLTSALSEYKGKEALYARQSPDVLEKLVERAKVESVESSNRIEGIDVKRDRVVDIVQQQSAPRTRPEEEVAGYRDALGYIHENHQAVPVSLHTITMLHQSLYKYTQQTGGEFKREDNQIIDRLKDGSIRVRFQPPPAGQTYYFVESLVAGYQFASQKRNFSPLVLIPLFVLDYLCIHPFTDGNGRTARLLCLLLLYHAGFRVGKYISLERVVEDSKETYYEALERSSRGWHELEHDAGPWLHYFYGVLLAAYKELESRVGVIREESSKTEQIKLFVKKTVKPFAISEIEEACPNISRDMIRVVLRELRDGGLIASTGMGRGAKWIRKG